MPALSAREDARKHARLLTLKQAAVQVQLSPWTLRRAIDRGELDGFRFGSRIRVSAQALEDWIDQARIAPNVIAPRRPRPSPVAATFRERARAVG